MGKSYTDLFVWQEAMSLAEDIYRVMRDFPKAELYGLVSQMRQQPCRFRATWPRAKDARRAVSSCSFLDKPADRSPSWAPKWRWPEGYR